MDADYLSRNALDEFVELRNKADKVIDTEDTGILLADVSRKGHSINFVNVNAVEYVEQNDELGRITTEDLMKAQLADKVIEPVYRIVEAGAKVTAKDAKTLGKDVKVLLKQLKKLSIVEGVLTRKTVSLKQVVLPEEFRHLVYTELHDKLGHLGPKRVLEQSRKRFYWPRMKNHIEHYVQKQCRCIISKQPHNPHRAPLVPVAASYPWEMLAIDYVKLDKAKGGYEYALMCVDHFTKFIQIFATKNKSALAAADKIYNDLILKYGFPTKIHHDQGREFDNSLFKRLHQLSGTKQSRTTPYHPQGNGLAERANRTLTDMLKTLSKLEKSNWARQLSKVAFAYNVTVNGTTKYSPYFLMFGRSPRLPIDAVFGLDINEDEKIPRTYEQYTDDWKNAMNQAFEIVKKHSKEKGEYNKKYYDQRVRGTQIEVGDRVLRRNREKGGTGKLRNTGKMSSTQLLRKTRIFQFSRLNP